MTWVAGVFMTAAWVLATIGWYLERRRADRLLVELTEATHIISRQIRTINDLLDRRPAPPVLPANGNAPEGRLH